VRVAHTGAATPATSLPDDIVIAGRIDADGLEVWAPKLAPALAADGLAGLRERFRRERVRALSIAPVADVLFRDQAGREEAAATVHRLAEVARSLGAAWLVATPGERPEGADDRDVGHEAGVTLTRLAELTGRYDVGLAITPDGHPRSALRTLAAAVSIVVRCRHHALGIAPDTFHLHAARSGPDEIAGCPPGRIAILRLADAPAQIEPEALRDADRRPPGHGVAPVGRLIALCRRLGVDPPAVVPVPPPAAEADHAGWARRLREQALALEHGPAPQPA
jgi:sugar phosphate isomerase/epimerase